MEILFNIKSCSISQINDLILILQKEIEQRQKEIERQKAIKRSGIQIIDFINEIPMSVRLRNCFIANYELINYPYLDDLSRNEFFKMRNAGKKSWEELKDIIFNRLNGTPFETQQSILQEHITRQEKLAMVAKELYYLKRKPK